MNDVSCSASEKTKIIVPKITPLSTISLSAKRQEELGNLMGEKRPAHFEFSIQN